MDDPGGMRGAQRVRDLAGVLNRLRNAQTFLRNQFRQGFARRHTPPPCTPFAVGDDVVNGDDVGMVERGAACASCRNRRRRSGSAASRRAVP